MRWFWRRERGESVETLQQVLHTITVDAVRANAEAFRDRQASDGEFLRLMAELKTTSAARTLGKKSGQARKARSEAKKTGVCPVCSGDKANATRAVIRWHLAGHPGRNPNAVDEQVAERQRNEQSGQAS